jgi:uncharacterized protein (TIGR03000 family)
MFGKRLLLQVFLASALAVLLTAAAGRAQYWYYPNSHWPSRDLYFTSGDGMGNYRVYYPMGRGDSYVVQPADIKWVNNPDTVLLEVRVPNDDSEVTVEGKVMLRQGNMRRYVSPPLEPGQRYHYEVRASWVENEKEINETRRVEVRAGQRVIVDFTRE